MLGRDMIYIHRLKILVLLIVSETNNFPKCRSTWRVRTIIKYCMDNLGTLESLADVYSDYSVSIMRILNDFLLPKVYVKIVNQPTLS